VYSALRYGVISEQYFFRNFVRRRCRALPVAAACLREALLHARALHRMALRRYHVMENVICFPFNGIDKWRTAKVFTAI
jgi:hypothetical protein